MSATEPEASIAARTATRPTPSMLDEFLPERSRQFALASLLASAVGVALAVPGAVGTSVVGYLVSSIGAVVLLTASRRADVAAVPAHDADPPRSARVAIRVLLAVAVVGTVLNAWILAPEIIG